MPAQFVPLWQYWWTGAEFMSTFSTSVSSLTPVRCPPTRPPRILPKYPINANIFSLTIRWQRRRLKSKNYSKWGTYFFDILFWHFSTKPSILQIPFDIILGYSNSVHQLTVKLQSQISEESSVRESSDCGWWTIYSSCLSLLSTFSQNYLKPKVSSSASATLQIYHFSGPCLL